MDITTSIILIFLSFLFKKYSTAYDATKDSKAIYHVSGFLSTFLLVLGLFMLFKIVL